ncbi:MAG: cupin domain-containing protein [Bacteroidia bacterium]|nr:cupin domain-containing protein [Bacteroidia bacterium]
MEDGKYWIEKLNLAPLPDEGGWYRECYRSDLRVSGRDLHPEMKGDRALSTTIYYLLQEGECSGLHRLKADEIWFFHAGNPLSLYLFGQEDWKEVCLGPGLENGEAFQCLVPRGTAFGAMVEKGFALVSNVVAPGFEFDDFALVSRHEILPRFPEAADIIRRLTPWEEDQMA